jgi:hypothetical protein
MAILGFGFWTRTTMTEYYKKAILPAAIAVALGGPSVASASDKPEATVGPATRQDCNTQDAPNRIVRRCKTYINGVLRELETDVTRNIVTSNEGSVVRDDYVLHSDKRYDQFGRPIFRFASCQIIRHVNGEQVPVICKLPEAYNKPLPPPPPIKYPS